MPSIWQRQWQRTLGHGATDHETLLQQLVKTKMILTATPTPPLPTLRPLKPHLAQDGPAAAPTAATTP
jgi:hypothetical protein